MSNQLTEEARDFLGSLESIREIETVSHVRELLHRITSANRVGGKPIKLIELAQAMGVYRSREGSRRGRSLCSLWKSGERSPSPKNLAFLEALADGKLKLALERVDEIAASGPKRRVFKVQVNPDAIWSTIEKAASLELHEVLNRLLLIWATAEGLIVTNEGSDVLVTDENGYLVANIVCKGRGNNLGWYINGARFKYAVLGLMAVCNAYRFGEPMPESRKPVTKLGPALANPVK